MHLLHRNLFLLRREKSTNIDNTSVLPMIVSEMTFVSDQCLDSVYLLLTFIDKNRSEKASLYQGFDNPCLYQYPALQRVKNIRHETQLPLFCIALLVFSVNKDEVSLLKKYLPWFIATVFTFVGPSYNVYIWWWWVESTSVTYRRWTICPNVTKCYEGMWVGQKLTTWVRGWSFLIQQ